jgi:hypothetical protein
MWAWREYGRHGFDSVVGSFIVTKPLTKSQLRRMPKALKNVLRFDDSVLWLEKLYRLEDPWTDRLSLYIRLDFDDAPETKFPAHRDSGLTSVRTAAMTCPWMRCCGKISTSGEPGNPKISDKERIPWLPYYLDLVNAVCVLLLIWFRRVGRNLLCCP